MEQDEATQLSHTLWREFDSMSARWTAPDPYGGSMALADPQSFNRYSYVNNDPVNQIDPQGLKSKACGGNNGTPCTQADDYETVNASELDQRTFNAALARRIFFRAAQGYIDDSGGYTTSMFDAHVPEPQNQTTQGTTTESAYSENSTMVVVWEGQEGAINPTFMFGHVSYILMQNDTSLSWEGWFNWTADTPSSDYTNRRSQFSSGMGYVLDFGPKINAKFQAALIWAYKNSLAGPAYNPIANNCAKAFSVAFNTIIKDIGWEGRRPALVLPSDVRRFITGEDPYGGLSKYLKAQQQFRKQ